MWADEPTGDLDSETAEEVTTLMRRLNLERGLTFLIVTHDIAVGRRTDRIIRMLDGQIVDEERMEVRMFARSPCLRSTRCGRHGRGCRRFRAEVLPLLQLQAGTPVCSS